jgi:hypothetical protein
LFSPWIVPLTLPVLGVAIALIASAIPHFSNAYALALLLVCGSPTALGICDLFQTRHAILRNYPISGHLRFLLENIRPELRQYFFEGEKDGMPFQETSGPSFTSVQKGHWTKGPSEPSMMSMTTVSSGCTIQSPPRRQAPNLSGSTSVVPIAGNRAPHRFLTYQR